MTDDSAEVARLREENARLREENGELKISVVAFGAPWAVRYAADIGLPYGALHPGHYDLLARCGARMDAFKRAMLAAAEGRDACACPQRAEVAAAAREHGPNSAERWRLCGEARCPAVEAGDA